MNNEVLNSWKEIAAYLGRGVRTVQRWERELNLPVRRPRGKDRSAVIALKSDIDQWLRHVPQRALTQHTTDSFRHEKLHISTELLIMRTHQILERSTQVQAKVKDTLALTIKLRTQQAERIRVSAARQQARQLLPTRTLGLTPLEPKPAVSESGLALVPEKNTFAAG